MSPVTVMTRTGAGKLRREGPAMRTWLLHSIAWLTARHIAHFETWQVLCARIGQFLMRKANPSLHMYYAEAMLQQAELHELKALSAAYEIKSLHTDDVTGETDWPDHAAVGLNMVAAVLIEQHDWEPEDVGLFIDDLSEGVFNFAATELEDDEE